MNTHLKDIINKSIDSVLKSNQFRRSGLKWNRVRGPFIDVVTLQIANYSDEVHNVFTLNIGVAVPAFHALIWPDMVSKFFIEADCVVRVRLGELINEKPKIDANNQWWRYDSSIQNTEQFVESLSDAIEEYGLPFFDNFKSIDDISIHLEKLVGWQSHNPITKIYLSLCAWHTGDSEKAKKILSSLIGNVWEKKAIFIRNLIINSEIAE
jgi:hypothetical protein